MDTVSPEVRSRMMAAVRSRNTKPEMRVRSLLHRMGFRFRLHRRDLPGSPDIVLPGLGTCIFVHGCFWHRHPHCPAASMPKTRVDFWRDKFESNIARDQRNEEALQSLGWNPVTIWECETRNLEALEPRLRDVLTFSKAHFKRKRLSRI